MNAHTPTPNVQEAVDFLDGLDRPGYHHLTAMSPEGAQAGIVGKLFAPGPTRDADVKAWVLEANSWHWNVYYSANEPRADTPPDKPKLSKQDIARIRMIGGDVDPRLPDDAPAGDTPEDDATRRGMMLEARNEVLAEAQELVEGRTPPSIAIDSGNGAQFAWILAEKLDATIENGRHALDAEEQGRGIAVEINGDAVGNIDRMLRLPGTVNYPTAGKRRQGKVGGPVRLLHIGAARYDLDTLSVTYAPVSNSGNSDRDAKVQAAIDGLDWNAAEAGATAELQTRLLEAGRGDAYFAALIRGQCKPPGDGSGSDWRAALVRAFKTRGWSLNDYAAVVLRWPAGQPSGAAMTPRMVARDWGRVGGQIDAEKQKTLEMFGPVEAEPDTSLFPAPVPESYDLVEAPAAPVEIEWINPADWHGFEPQEKIWYVPGLIPHNEVTMLTGKGGIGKSLLALQALICIALGLPFFGRPTKRARVVGFFCEDDPDVLHRRTKDICAVLGVDVRELDGWMRLASRKYADNLLAAYEGARGGPMMKRTAVFEKLEAFCVEFGAEVALLDTIADVFGGNEIDRQQVRQFVQGCAGRLAGSLGACIIVGHPSKSGQAEGGDGTSGSTAWHGSVRSRLYLEEAGEKGSGYVKLTLMKSNYGPSGESWIMRYRAGVLDVVSASEPSQGVPETTSLIHSVVLAAISKARAADVRLVMAANSPHNAAKVLRRRDADMLKPYSKEQLHEALSQLVALGVVAEENVGYDKTRNPLKSLVVRGQPDELSDTVIPVSEPEGGFFD